MKKNLIPSFSTVLFLIIFISCQKEGKEMETETLSYNNTFYLTPTDTAYGSLRFSAEVEIPVKFHNSEILQNVRKQIIASIFGETYNSFPVDSVLPKYANALYQDYKRTNDAYLNDTTMKEASASLLHNEIDIQGVAMYVDSKILSYSYERYAFLGGAHGNTSRLLYNFDLSNSQLIKEKDLFVDNFKDPLTTLIKQQIVEDNSEMESVADLNDFNFYEDQIVPNNNFYITPEGIVYVYNPYDIAPYSMGQTSVLLTFEKLKPILKKNNPIEYLYKNIKPQ